MHRRNADLRHTRIARSLTALAAAAAGLIVAGSAAPAHADVNSYAVARYVSYTQTSDAAPTTPEFWMLVALATSDVNSEMIGGSVSFMRPPRTEFPLGLATVNLQEFVSPLYSDLQAFLNDFPATTYTVEVDRGFGPESGSVFLPEDLFSPEIPALTGDTFTRLQALDASAGFVGTVGGFTLAPGTNSGWTYLAVVPDQVETGAVWTELLEPNQTTFTIPAGTLRPDTGYTIGVTYFNQVLTQDAGLAGAEAGAEFHRGTGAAFRTRSETPACPGDFNQSGDVTVQDIFDFLAAYFANDLRADMNGSGDVGVQDIFDFLAAYFAGC